MIMKVFGTNVVLPVVDCIYFEDTSTVGDAFLKSIVSINYLPD